MYCHDTWHRDVICLLQKLFYDLWSAFSYCHGSQCTIAGMAVWSKDHRAAGCQHLSCKLMDYCLMRWYIDSTIFFGTGKSKYMVIFIDGSTYCAQTVVAICQHIRYREFLQAWRSGSLQDSYKCDIMRCKFIKLNLQIFHIARCVVRRQNTISHGSFCCFFFCRLYTGLALHGSQSICCIRNQFISVYQICSAFI